jgi:hypothetical protein
MPLLERLTNRLTAELMALHAAPRKVPEFG